MSIQWINVVSQERLDLGFKTFGVVDGLNELFPMPTRNGICDGVAVIVIRINVNDDNDSVQVLQLNFFHQNESCFVSLKLGLLEGLLEAPSKELECAVKSFAVGKLMPIDSSVQRA